MLFAKAQKIAVGVFALLLLVAATVVASKQEKASERPPAQIPGQAEMERLKFYLGEWDYTETYPKLTGTAFTKHWAGASIHRDSRRCG